MKSNMSINPNTNLLSNVNNVSANLNLQNMNEKKKDEFNFEKLLIGILEFKQEAFKSLKVFSDFFKNYLNKNDCCNNTKEIIGFMSKFEENKKIIKESKINF